MCLFSTRPQIAICDELIRKNCLGNLFIDAIRENEKFNNIQEPFLGEHFRIDPSEKSIGTNKVINFLRTNKNILQLSADSEYLFEYAQREISPFRMTSSNRRTSGSGGMDYLGRANGVPVIGEIKYKTDQNPFYALVQLLTYLSEMATENQWNRIKIFDLFGIEKYPENIQFDLHIFLSNFNHKGEKGKLLEKTNILASQTVKTIRGKNINVINKIMCIECDIEKKEISKNPLWVV